MAIKPLTDKIVATKATPPTKTASGIILNETKDQIPAYAVVESVGPDVKTIKAGDKIIFKEFSATEVKIDDVQYFIVKNEDILAVVE